MPHSEETDILRPGLPHTLPEEGNGVSSDGMPARAANCFCEGPQIFIDFGFPSLRSCGGPATLREERVRDDGLHCFSDGLCRPIESSGAG